MKGLFDTFVSHLAAKYVVFAGVACVVGAFFGYFLLLARFPLVVGPVSAVAFILGVGLLMTKCVIGFTNPKLVWGLAPVFGSAWLAWLWLILNFERLF